MKTMNDIKQDMSTLYDELKAGAVDLKLAAELSNVAGKNLKAEQLILAREIFENGIAPKLIGEGSTQNTLTGNNTLTGHNQLTS